ncbi:hypothetical protein [Bifidobacterium choloepi]|uniref:Uncharacterized protein n=1 Tax=Bifidobacterium choloepi TaxID=2614131 RepID=A0A6I5NGS2_9BIFI|nr:hypothetical protein [Bifidobacterium choloepi]NEG69563.1 hypothetical protein [Bifidobacterium choloepi]
MGEVWNWLSLALSWIGLLQAVVLLVAVTRHKAVGNARWLRFLQDPLGGAGVVCFLIGLSTMCRALADKPSPWSLGLNAVVIGVIALLMGIDGRSIRRRLVRAEDELAGLREGHGELDVPTFRGFTVMTGPSEPVPPELLAEGARQSAE